MESAPAGAMTPVYSLTLFLLNNGWTAPGPHPRRGSQNGTDLEICGPGRAGRHGV
jgi:hypothetical protein